jgi:hypothetical protein
MDQLSIVPNGVDEWEAIRLTIKSLEAQEPPPRKQPCFATCRKGHPRKMPSASSSANTQLVVGYTVIVDLTKNEDEDEDRYRLRFGPF